MAMPVKLLLRFQQKDWQAYTPITLKCPHQQGLEPDYCFYIDNWEAAVGKDRIDWQTDLPPDLVIEIDVTTYTAAADYLPYKVPEVWLFKKSGLKIYNLEGETYQLQPFSRYFPEIDLPTAIAQVLQVASQQGTGVALREFRQGLTD